MAAYPTGAALRAQLFGVEPFEPVVIGGTALFLIATAALASWLPSRQAANVEPSAALKAE